MMKKNDQKLRVSRIIRRITQTGSFLLIPGLFISIFSAIKDIFTSLINGTFSFSTLSFQLLLLGAIVPVTVLMGRFFCGHFCAFGSMQDLLWFISRKVHKKTTLISEGSDRILRSLKYIILSLIVVLVWTFGLVSFGSTESPWTIFGMLVSLSGWPSASILLTVGAVLLILIMIGSFFVERFFCRYLCPLGAVFSLLSMPRLFRIRKPRKACDACTLCTRECTMGIPLSGSDQVNSGECINCFECVEVCPRHNVKASPTPAVATSIAAATIAGLYCIGSLVDINSASAVNDVSTVSTISNISTEKYTDGVYTGSAAGFRGTTEVQVTVTNGEIEDIEVLSTSDDSQYFSRAESSVITNILLSQSTDVSTVSGATFSSNAIINAVKSALVSSDSNVTTDVSSSNIQSDAANDTQAASSTDINADAVTTITAANSYPDGTYTGSGTGFRGETTVCVTVAGGVITDITVVSYADDAPYFNRAENAVISSIISQQNIDVSTVSGATFSSNSIMEAVANALSVDFTNPNSSLPAHGHKK